MKIKEQRGVLTIEATLSLTAFLFVFMIIYSLINICSAQAAIQVALNNSAKQIAQYTYLYGLTGFDESFQGMYEAGESGKKNTISFINSVGEAWSAFSQLGSDAADLTQNNDNSIDGLLGQLETIGNDFNDLKSKGSDAYNIIKNAAKNPKQIVIVLTKLLASDGLELAKSRLIAAPICSAIVDNNLRTSSTDSAESFCKRVGIVDGYDGMDFSSSTILTQNTDDIKIVVKYKIKVLQLLPIDSSFEFVQVAQTIAWMHGDGNKVSADNNNAGGSGNAGNNVTGNVGAVWSEGMTLDDRNTMIRRQALKELVDNEGYNTVSGETYIQAYNRSTNTFTQVVVSNALFKKNSVDEVDMVLLKQQLEKCASTMESTVSTRTDITIKKVINNRTEKEKINLDDKGEKKLEVILVIPEDPGLKEKYEQVISGLGTNVNFVIEQGYGTALGE